MTARARGASTTRSALAVLTAVTLLLSGCNGGIGGWGREDREDNASAMAPLNTDELTESANPAPGEDPSTGSSTPRDDSSKRSRTGPGGGAGGDHDIVLPRARDAGKITGLEPIDLRDKALAGVAADAYRIRYTSTSATTAETTTVTGLLFVPQRKVPRGGFEVVAYAHGSVGVMARCSPSAVGKVGGNAGDIAAMLNDGRIVVATDYEGLGGGGAHPYLDPRTEAMNVVDSYFAVRDLLGPAVSSRWGVLGPSQGGQAAWATAEFFGPYAGRAARGLRLVGGAALEPSVDRSEMVPMMMANELPTHQQLALPMVLSGLRLQFPGVSTGDFLHGPLARDDDALLGCDHSDVKQQVREALQPWDTRPTSVREARELYVALRSRALPRTATDVPLFVAYGTEDSIIYPRWILNAVDTACTWGHSIELERRGGEGHADRGAVALGYQFLQRRFAGKDVDDHCAH